MLRRLLCCAAVAAMVAACGTAPTATPTRSPGPTVLPSPSTALAPTSPEPTQAAEPTRVPEPTQAAKPTQAAEPTEAPGPTPTRGPDKAWRGDAELALRRGVRDDIAASCRPGNGPLPRGVLAELRCGTPTDGVALVTLRLYASRWDLMDAWETMVTRRGIEPMSHGGRCEPGRSSEGGYVPGDGHGVEVAERSACWLDRDGSAHYLATIPSFVLVRVDGVAGGSIPKLEAWAWLGSRDQPGNPTLWHGRR